MDGCYAGSPAEEAGILAGDRIAEIGGPTPQLYQMHHQGACDLGAQPSEAPKPCHQHMIAAISVLSTGGEAASLRP